MANKETDTRIVEMQFDAKDFDKNIKNSSKNLEDFKKELNFDDAVKQMGTVVEKGGAMDESLKSMATNVAKLTKEFTGIGNVSTFVAQKIKSAWQGAANSMERFIKSMTTDQISEGSNKYNMLLQSVQTIMNATGDSEDYVYEVMGKLNKYTDETSYNFADMAQNIGKFTTAGVKLSDAETEMEGIANWAAMAGQNATTASRAMYNISQAMSADAMLKIDWKSIQNAGMDTRWFRQEALDAAVAAGTLKKSAEGVYKTVKGGKQVTLDNFTETLQYKWFDKSTMETVFKTFADNTQGIGEKAYKAAQRCTTFNDALGAWKDMLSTGWMKTYEHVFGKLSDAMNLFSGICNKVTDSLDAFVSLRNGILEGWSLDGGRTSLWSALVGELETPDSGTLFEGAFGILDAMQTIGDAIYDAFWDFVRNFMDPEDLDAFDADREGQGMAFLSAKLIVLTDSFKEFTNGLKDFFFTADEGETETRFDRMRHVAEAIYAAITLIVEVVKGVFQFAGELGTQLYPAFHTVELLISYLAQMFTGKVADGVKKNTIGNFFHNLAEILRPVTSVINFVVVSLAKLIIGIVDAAKKSGIIEMLGTAFQWLINKITTKIEEFMASGIPQMIFGWIQTAISKIPALVSRIKTFAKTVSDSAKNNKKLSGFIETVKDIFSVKNLKTLLTKIKNWVKKLIDKVPTLFSFDGSGIGGFFSKIFDGILGLFVGTASADSATESVSDAIAQPILELTNGDTIGKTLDSAVEKVKPTILGKLKEKLGNLVQTVKDFFTNIGSSEIWGKIKTFFSGTNFKDLLSGAKELMKWISIFKIGSGIGQFGKGMKSIGKGIKVFGKNLKNLKNWNFKDMFNIFSGNTDNSKSFNFGNIGPQLLEIAAAIGILVFAAKEIVAMKPEDLEKAGLSLAALLAGLLIASYTAKKVAGNGLALLSIAVALWLIIKPMQTLMTIPWTDGKGLGGGLLEAVGKLFVVMAAIALAARIAGKIQLKGLIGMAIAVTLLMVPIKILAGMEGFIKDGKFNADSPLFQAVVALSALMLAIAGAVRLAGKDNAKGMASIVLAITALAAVGWLIGNTLTWEKALIGFAPIIILIGMMALLFKSASKLSVEQVNSVKTIFTAFAVMVSVMAIGIIALSALDVKESLILEYFGGMILVMLSLSLLVKKASKLKTKSLGKVSLVLGLMSVLIAVTAGSLIALAKTKVDWKVIAAFTVGLTAMIVGLGIALPMLSKLSVKGVAIAVAALAAAIIAVMGSIALILPYVLGSVGNSLQSLSTRLKTISGLLKDFFARMNEIGGTSTQHALDVFDCIKDLVMKFVGFGDHTADINAVEIQLRKLSTAISMFYLNENKIVDPKNSKSFATLEKFVEIAPSLQTVTFGNIADEMFSLGTALSLFDYATTDLADPQSSNSFAILSKFIDIAPSLQTVTFGNISNEMFSLGVALSLYDYATADIKSGDESPSISLITAITGAADGKSGTIGTLPSAIYRLGGALGSFIDKTSNITSADSPALGFLKALFEQADNIKTLTELNLEGLGGQLSTLGGGISLYAKGASQITGIHLDDSGNAVDANGDPLNMEASIGILRALSEALTDEKLVSDLQTASEQLEGLATKTNLGTFAANLESLGNALATFASASNSMQGENADKAISLISLLGQMGGYLTPDNLEVVKSFDDAGIGGDGQSNSALSNFALDVELLGGALGKFADITKNSVFDGGLGALEKLGTLNTKLTTSNLRFAKSFTGSNLSGNGSDGNTTPLGIFALDIGKLGTALGKFSDLTKNKTFDGSLGALDKFGTLNEKLTSDTLAFAKVFTSSDLSGKGSTGNSTPLGIFALDIGKLGTALGEFATLTGNAVFDNGFGAIDKFHDLNQKLTEENLGFLSIFTDAGISGTGKDSVMGQFGNDIAELGTCMGSFATNVVDENGKPYDFSNAISSLNSLVTLKNRLPDTGGLKELIMGHKLKLDDLGNEVQGLGQSLHDFSDKISGVDDNGTGLNYEAVTNALNIIQQLVNITNAMSMINPDTGNIYGSGYFVNNLNEIMTGLLNTGFMPNVEDVRDSEGKYISFAQALASFAADVSEAFADAGTIDTEAIKAFSDIANALHNLMTIDPSLNFEYPGQMIALGVKSGIEQRQSEVVNAAIAMVQAAIDAANDTAAIKSPSHVFKEMGNFMDLGLVEGLYGGQDKVEGASEDMMSGAIDKAGLLMGAISAALAEDVDLQPKIAPVLDLSNLTESSAALNGIFDGYALNLTSALNRATAATGSSGPTEVVIQNPTDLSGIQASINTFHTEIANLQTAISNIKIVLNTGVVAGSLTDDIDSNLGRKSLYAGRRN